MLEPLHTKKELDPLAIPASPISASLQELEKLGALDEETARLMDEPFRLIREAMEMEAKASRETEALLLSQSEEERKRGFVTLIKEGFSELRVPPALHEVSLLEVPKEMRANVANAIAKRESMGLVGKPGIGKSGACALVVAGHLKRKLIELGPAAVRDRKKAFQSVLWIDWPTRSDEIKRLSTASAWENPKAYINPEIRVIEGDVELVVLDDLGREKTSPHPAEQLFLLADWLYQYGRHIQVVWTSNLPVYAERTNAERNHAGISREATSLSWVYGPAFVSRLCGMAPAHEYAITHDKRWE